MSLVIASDHGGYQLKQEITQYFDENNITYVDLGVFSTESVDYPDIAISCAEAVARGEYEKGIIVCGTGIGVCIAANKVKGIRAALCHDVFSAGMSRRHNNSNILTMGGRVIGPSLAVSIVKEWLSSEFEGDRHIRRVKKITEYENKDK